MEYGVDDRQSYYAAAILLWAQQNNREYFSQRDLLSWKEEEWDDPYLAVPELVDLALTQLCSLDALFAIPDEFGPTVYETVNDKDIRELGETFPNSPFYKVARYGAAWTIEALQSINSSWAENPIVLEDNINTEEDQWSPIDVDFDDELTSAAIKNSEDALEVIEQSNGYANSDPEERDSIVSVLRGTIEAVKAGKPTKKIIIEGLLNPLKYISKKFADAAMGKAAQAAVAALAKWLFGA